jgi:hypothetical protein
VGPNPEITDSQLGQVFSSALAFARERYQGSLQEQPVKVQLVAGSDWVWVVAGSARHSGAWHLFRQLPEGGVKYVLCHPAAVRVEGVPQVTGGGILFVQSFAPTAAEQRVSFRFDEELGYYVPDGCWLRVARPSAPPAEDVANVPAACQSSASSDPFVEIPVDCEGRAGHCD